MLHISWKPGFEGLGRGVILVMARVDVGEEGGCLMGASFVSWHLTTQVLPPASKFLISQGVSAARDSDQQQEECRSGPLAGAWRDAVERAARRHVRAAFLDFSKGPGTGWTRGTHGCMVQA